MKWTGNERVLTRTLTIVAAVATAALTLLILASCGHKSLEDSLAAGDQAMQNNKLADAENNYRDAVAAAPNDPRPHIALGNLYVFEQRPVQAQAEYIKAIELDGADASVHTALGSVFDMQSEPGLAEDQYRAAVALAPANAAYRTNLGMLLQKQGKIGAAEAEFRTAVGLEPKNAHAHLALAKVLSGEPDRATEAESEFAQVRILDPTLMTGALQPAPTAAEASPEASSEAGALPSPTLAAPAAATPPVRPLDRKFLLAHDSPVYETPQETANVVAQVHRRKFVHVTGIAGSWLRIQMKNGTVGFIPAAAAE
jgi:Flp pilus assembly protein TadD